MNQVTARSASRKAAVFRGWLEFELDCLMAGARVDASRRTASGDEPLGGD